MKPVLWIEDLARVEYREMFATVFRDGRYNLSVAVSATEGVSRILKHQYEAVIVDIRLPPGSDAEWIELYGRAGASEEAAKLGKHLVHSVLGAPTAEITLLTLPTWLNSAKVGFLTVEPWADLGEELEALGIRRARYVEKGPMNERDALLRLIELVVEGGCD